MNDLKLQTDAHFLVKANFHNLSDFFNSLISIIIVVYVSHFYIFG